MDILVVVGVVIMIVVVDIMDILVVVGVVMMMLAQVGDVVVDMFVLLVGMLRVRRRGRVRDSLVNGLIVSVHVMVSQVDVVAVVVAVVVTVMNVMMAMMVVWVVVVMIVVMSVMVAVVVVMVVSA